MTGAPPEPISRDAPPGGVGRAVMTQEWAELTYVHWPSEPHVIRPFLPQGVEPDVVDGATWVGLVPFAMRRVRLLGTPPIPVLSSFLETNVRTYTVGPDGRRGVFFLTLEADRLMPVLAARAAYRLPYTWSQMSLQRKGNDATYRSRRRWPAAPGATSLVRISIGPPHEPTDLDHSLTARWGLHSTWWGGRVAFAPVQHARWPLHAAELLEVDHSLVAAVGLPAPEGEPRGLHSPGVSVRVGWPHRLADRR